MGGSQTEPQPQPQTKRVAICDDDAEMRAWLRVLLRPFSVHAEDAADGQELLRLIGARGPFDLIITDIRMPRTSGIHVVATARAHGIDTPFLVITAFPEQRVRELVLGLPGTELLEKPFEASGFRQAVARLLQTPAANESESEPSPT